MNEIILAPIALWISGGVLLGFVSIISAVLLYHWRTYGANERVVKRAEILYAAVVGLFFIALALFAIVYTIS